MIDSDPSQKYVMFDLVFYIIKYLNILQNAKYYKIICLYILRLIYFIYWPKLPVLLASSILNIYIKQII